jgi:hypothetical protein
MTIYCNVRTESIRTPAAEPSSCSDVPQGPCPWGERRAAPADRTGREKRAVVPVAARPHPVSYDEAQWFPWAR